MKAEEIINYGVAAYSHLVPFSVHELTLGLFADLIAETYDQSNPRNALVVAALRDSSGLTMRRQRYGTGWGLYAS